MREAMRARSLGTNGGDLCAALVAVLCLAGCVTDVPVVSREGKIIGGNPKLNGLLHRIKGMRDEKALADDGVLEAVYVASVQPTPQAVWYGGVLPAAGKAVAARYSLVCSGETINAAAIATVTQFLVLRKNETIRTDTYSVVLLWRDNRWKESPMTRLDQGMPAQEEPESTISPSSHRNAATLPGSTSPRVFPAPPQAGRRQVNEISTRAARGSGSSARQ